MKTKKLHRLGTSTIVHLSLSLHNLPVFDQIDVLQPADTVALNVSRHMSQSYIADNKDTSNPKKGTVTLIWSDSKEMLSRMTSITQAIVDGAHIAAKRAKNPLRVWIHIAPKKASSSPERQLYRTLSAAFKQSVRPD